MQKEAIPESPSAPTLSNSLPERFLTVKGAAHYALVSQSTIRRWIRDDGLPVYKAGRQIRINPRDLVKFMSGHE